MFPCELLPFLDVDCGGWYDYVLALILLSDLLLTGVKVERAFKADTRSIPDDLADLDHDPLLFAGVYSA